jgi:hypothetical protein
VGLLFKIGLPQQPDLAPSKEHKLTFGQLLRPENITPDTFAEVEEFDCWFEDETVDLEDAENWFQINILGVEEPDTSGENILTDSKLISHI